MPSIMDSLSGLSSLHEEIKSENYIEPHYKEWYRVAIEALIEGGRDSYLEFLSKEGLAEFLAEEELDYIVNNIKTLPDNVAHGTEDGTGDDASSSGTYWPMESDVEAPNLDLGWPNLVTGISGPTQIELLFHPPRAQPLTIKETARKMIKEAKQVVAIVMDMFTDVDLFKEIVDVSTRGIPVYILLDESNAGHFLKMTENQDVQIQRNRYIRVRTVKGQDYYSKSGAKFCGKMDQKFLMTDNKKVMFGTYSFMWSFEKVNLSMVQLITGQLVESFDEEFRTLYARSSVPQGFVTNESSLGKHRKITLENGFYQHSLTSLASSSSQQSLFSRPNHMQQMLQSSYLKSQGRYTTNEDDRYSMRNTAYRPQINSGYNVQQKIQQLQQAAKTENWKRHSYAGREKPERSPFLMLNRGANFRTLPSHNWKPQTDNPSVGSSSRGGYIGTYNGSTQGYANQYAQQRGPNLTERNSNLRSSFHGTDSHVRNIQQRMPTLERTTKSFLRNWRIESYLNDHADFSGGSIAESVGDRNESTDGTENVQPNSLYTSSRLRSSLVYKTMLPEQKESNSCTTNSTNSNSTIIDSQEIITPKAQPPKENASMRVTADKYFTGYGTNQQTQPEADKRNDVQAPESVSYSSQYSVNKPPTSYLYTSFCTNKQGDNVKSQQNESILKRRSLPMFESLKINTENSAQRPPHNYIYSSLMNNGRRQTQNQPGQQNDQQNSNVTKVNTTNEHDKIVEAPLSAITSRNMSNDSLNEALRDDSSKEWSPKKENKGSPNFLKKGSKKLRSLLSLTPDKKETLSKSKAPAFIRMCSSSDTLVSEEDETEKFKSVSKNEEAPRIEGSLSSALYGALNRSKESVYVSPSKDGRQLSPSVSRAESKFSDITGDASTPRFNTEQIQYQEPKESRMQVGYGTAYVSTSLQRLRPQTNMLLQRELPQRDSMQRELPQRDSMQRELPQRDSMQREMPQRDLLHREMPQRVGLQRALSHRDILQRDVPARDMMHRDIPSRDMLQREMPPREMAHRAVPQRELSQREIRNADNTPALTRMSDRRIYSRFEQFYTPEGPAQPDNKTENTCTPVMDQKSNSMGHNYSRQAPVLSYNSSVYNTYQQNENKFGRFMQKFGNLIHKNK